MANTHTEVVCPWCQAPYYVEVHDDTATCSTCKVEWTLDEPPPTIHFVCGEHGGYTNLRGKAECPACRGWCSGCGLPFLDGERDKDDCAFCKERAQPTDPAAICRATTKEN